MFRSAKRPTDAGGLAPRLVHANLACLHTTDVGHSDLQAADNVAQERLVDETVKKLTGGKLCLPSTAFATCDAR